ncbi:MAG: HEAT repeat domain-containing protein, partial [Candidatus Flexifilum sp.]
MQVFISYRNLPEYVEWTEKLKKWLEERGYTVWLDRYSIERGITPNSTTWRKAIAQGIRHSQAMLVIYAPECFGSDIVVDEWELGRANGLHVYFLKVKDVPTKDVLPGYVHVQYIDMAREDAWAALTQDLEKARSTPKQLSDDPFAAYLRDALEVTFTILSARTHEAQVREIDLRVSETPQHVDKPSMPAPRPSKMKTKMFIRAGLPDRVEALQEEQVEIETLAQCMEKVNNRLLLLGEPGAGKTFTLYQYAYEMIRRRQSEGANAPLPILMLCATWPSSPPTPLSTWIRENWKGLENLREEDLASCLLLFDGLDELGAERVEKMKDENGKEVERTYDPRLRFLQALPESGAVIVSTRVEEYEAIGHKARLNGAVTLRPLTDEQIRDYLSNYPLLWQALERDRELLDVLRTPLLLSCMAFAYKDDPGAVQLLADKDSVEMSDAIFARYVQERHVHEARRLEDIGQAPPYSLETLYEVLGHAAMANANAVGAQRRSLQTPLSFFFAEANIFQPVDFAPFVGDTEAFLGWVELLDLMNRADVGLRFVHLRLRDYFGRSYALKHLSDANARMRRAAAEALGELGDVRAVAPLIDRLKDRDSDVRRAADEALVQIGAASVAPLIECLKDEVWNVKRAAAQALGKLKDRRAVAPLIECLKDGDWEVRRAAAWALVQLGDVRAVAPLIACLEDQEDWVRGAAAEALGQLGDVRAVAPLIECLKDGDWEVRRAAAWALRQLGDGRAVAPLIDCLEDEIWIVRETASQALGQLGWQPQTQEQEITYWIAKRNWDALVEIGEASVAPIINRLKDEDTYVRQAAAKALGQLGWQPQTQEQQITYWIVNQNWDALVEIGGASIALLIGCLKDGDWDVRQAAVEALEKLGDRQAVALLIDCLKDRDWEVRRAAAEMLGHLGDRRAVAPLIDCLEDGD